METQAPTIFAEKFEQIKARFRLKNADLARIAGVSDNAITKVMKGLTESPDVRTLIAIGKELNLSADWMLYGEGPMVREDVPDGSLKKGLQIRDELIAQLQKELWGKLEGVTEGPLTTEEIDKLMLLYKKKMLSQVLPPKAPSRTQPVVKMVALG